MASIETSNRFDPDEEPELHEAWSDGYRAGQNDESVPEEYTNNPDEKASAWIDGYTAAQLPG